MAAKKAAAKTRVYNVRVIEKPNGAIHVDFVHEAKYHKRDDFFDWKDVTRTEHGIAIISKLQGKPMPSYAKK